MNPAQAGLLGAETRCGTCRGHLGDVFSDGMLFVNTPAFVSGKRYYIDGVAVILKPADGGDGVFGDITPPAKTKEMPGVLPPPKLEEKCLSVH